MDKMKMKFRSLMSLLLCMVMLCSLLGTAAFADDAVTAITLDPANVNLTAGGTATITPTVTTTDTDNTTITAKSNNENIATVAVNGDKTVTVTAGTTTGTTTITVTATCNTDSSNMSAECTINVSEATTTVSYKVVGADTVLLLNVAAGNYYKKSTDATFTQITSDMIQPATEASANTPYIIITGCTTATDILYSANADGSSPQTVSVPKSAAPAETDYTATIKSDDYSSIITTRSDLEYSADNGSTWIAISQNTATSFTGTILLRVKNDTANLASDTVTIGSGAAATYYPLWVEGVHVSSSNLSGSGWSFNPYTNTLSITGNITAYYYSAVELSELKNGAAIYYEGTDALNILSTGDYTIQALNGETTPIDRCYGIYDANDASITFSGKLSVYSGDAATESVAIACWENSGAAVTIASGADITAYCGDSTTSVGISAKTLTVKGAVEGIGGTASQNSYGIETNELIVSDDTSSVIGTGEESDLNSYGIYAETSLTMYNGTATGTGDVAAKMNDAGGVESNNAQSIGVYAGTITVIKGVLTGTGAEATYQSVGIQATTMNITDGTVNGTSATAMYTSAAVVPGTMVMQGGKLTATYSGSGTSYNYAIMGGTIDQRGGEIIANAPGTNAAGISSAVTMSGNAKLTATSGAGYALTALPSYSGYTAEAKSGASESAAETIPSANLSDLSYYTKNYVSIKPIIATTAIDLGSDITLGLNGTKTIEVTYTPTTATDTELVWSSNDTSIATVDQNGVVTAKGKGSTKIIAKLKSDETIYDYVNVTVTTIPVTGISISPTSLTVAEGESATIAYTVTPSDASNPEVTVSYNNTYVNVSQASSSSDTVTVKGVSAGATSITFTTTDGSYSVTCPVTVTAKTLVTGIAITDTTGTALSTLTLTTKGTSKTVYATVLPTSATNKAVEWTASGNNTIIYLTDKTDTSCVINAYGNGTATVTATAKDGSGVYATITVVVNDSTSTYKFTYKDNSGVWYYDSLTYSGFTVKCDGPYSLLTGVLMDGYVVSPNYYTVTEGSTIVTFPYSYMSYLSHGRHTLSFVYGNTTTVSTYIWSRSLYDPPITGDTDMTGLIGAMSISAMAAGACTVILKKRKED